MKTRVALFMSVVMMFGSWGVPSASAQESHGSMYENASFEAGLAHDEVTVKDTEDGIIVESEDGLAVAVRVVDDGDGFSMDIEPLNDKTENFIQY